MASTDWLSVTRWTSAAVDQHGVARVERDRHGAVDGEAEVLSAAV